MNTKKILNAIKKANHILISTHINPDLDGLSCELVMTKYLKSLGKKVLIANAEKVPAMYEFLKGAKQIKKISKTAKQCDLAIIFDCGDLNRIGEVKNFLPEGIKIINIDHHQTNKEFGTYNLVLPKASSSAEVLFSFLNKQKFKLTKETSELLYLGILTDTGSFRYQSTSSYTHEIAAQLLKFNLPTSDLYKKVYENLNFSDLKVLLDVLKDFTSIENGRILCVDLKKEVLLKSEGKFDLRDKIFSFLRMVNDCEVILIFSEDSKNLTKVNLRSSGKINVASLASQYGGGGHKAASGCRYKGNLENAKKSVISSLRRQF